jgi:hypothetical protein
MSDLFHQGIPTEYGRPHTMSASCRRSQTPEESGAELTVTLLLGRHRQCELLAHRDIGPTNLAHTTVRVALSGSQLGSPSVNDLIQFAVGYVVGAIIVSAVVFGLPAARPHAGIAADGPVTSPRRCRSSPHTDDS